MRRGGFFAALALLIVVNVVVLGGVAWNRMGPPEASLRLTERELPVRRIAYRNREDSGLALQLTVSKSAGVLEWLNEAKLRELGFRPQDYQWQEDAEGWRTTRPLPRAAYLVLEFDGPAWGALVAERAQQLQELTAKVEDGEATIAQVERAEQRLQRTRISDSRLIPVDAGTDPQALRQRYPDRSRYLIVGAKIRMWHSSGETRSSINQILVGRIHVPLQHHAALAPVLDDALHGTRRREDDEETGPRYELVLNYGVRHEPWISEITPLK